VHDKAIFKASFYLAKKDGKDSIALLVECVHAALQSQALQGATRVYLVLEGRGSFTINDKKKKTLRRMMFFYYF